MFKTWLQEIRWKEKNLILTSVSAVYWTMWLIINDIIFVKVNPQICLDTLDKILGFARERGGQKSYIIDLSSVGQNTPSKGLLWAISLIRERACSGPYP